MPSLQIYFLVQVIDFMRIKKGGSFFWGLTRKRPARLGTGTMGKRNDKNGLLAGLYILSHPSR
jgi:hypothetical protein